MSGKGSSRKASEQERALFEQALKDAKPLGEESRERGAKQDLPETIPQQTRQGPARPGRAPSLQPIDRHLAGRLKRGQVEPLARLDLHGLHEAAAYASLARFLARSRDADKRLVLVITGKGVVLRENLPRWLVENPFRGFVAGMSQAHSRHGGDGAFYVTLRKKRSSR